MFKISELPFMALLLGGTAMGVYSEFHFLTVISTGIFLAILGGKSYYAYWTPERIIAKEKSSAPPNSVFTKKYERASAGRMITSKVGLLIAISAIFCGFSWVSFEVEEPSIVFVKSEDDDPIKVTVTPITPEPPIIVSDPKPPKVVKKIVPPKIKIVDDKTPVPVEPKKIEIKLDDKAIKDILDSKSGPAKAKLPKRKEKKPEPPKYANLFELDAMPIFQGCNKKRMSKEEKFECSMSKMKTFIMNRIKYPALARENGIEGKVLIQFSIEKDGAIGGLKVRRDPHHLLSDEVIRVMKLVPNWEPAMQGGKKVAIRYAEGFSFKLDP